MEQLIKKALSSSNKVSKNSSIKKIIPVHGGCIHKAWCIHFQNEKKIFAKSNHINNINMFKFERDCLLILKNFADKSRLCLPKPLDLIIYKDVSVFLLEWIDLKGSQQNLLGQGLALLHKFSSEYRQTNFGWEADGYIGVNSQVAGWGNNWGEFFVNYRLRPQLEKAESWGVRVNDYEDILNFLRSYLNDHHPKVSLVHGDLWSGNCGTTKSGLGILYDPASYWADREVDISMTKLFGGFNREFYRGYEEIWPLDKLSKERTDIYNLYHLLNHANMFGGSYTENSLKILKDLRSRM